MKLTLADQHGISVLESRGDVTARDVQVLKAGLTNLLRSGKNRIVLDLPGADKLPGELLREISQLDVLARELSGRIVISGVGSAAREQITRFAQPPVITCFESKAKAIQSFAPQAADVQKPSGEPAKLKPQTAEEKKKAKEDARQQFRNSELGEMHQLRQAVSQLEAEVALLRKQLGNVLVTRRIPANEEVYRARILELEQEVVGLNERLAAATPKP